MLPCIMFDSSACLLAGLRCDWLGILDHAVAARLVRMSIQMKTTTQPPKKQSRTKPQDDI